MTPKEYELFIRDYVQTLADQFVASQDQITVKHNHHEKGKSGAEHQFDVYFVIKGPLLTTKVAVECKNFTGTVEIGRVRDFYGALVDVGASGVMVTTVAYQRGAKIFAEHYGINLILVQTPQGAS